MHEGFCNHSAPTRILAVVVCVVVRTVTMLLSKWVAEREDAQTACNNAILVAREFLYAVKVYGGVGCINRRLCIDKRFKITRNGSYYEVCGYTFTYNFMHGTDEVWWTFVDFDATVIYRNVRMTRGECYIRYMIQEGLTII